MLADGREQAHLPAGMDMRPTQMRPFMKVPVVRTAARHRKERPKNVRTPRTWPKDRRSSAHRHRQSKTARHLRCSRYDMLKMIKRLLQESIRADVPRVAPRPHGQSVLTIHGRSAVCQSPAVMPPSECWPARQLPCRS